MKYPICDDMNDKEDDVDDDDGGAAQPQGDPDRVDDPNAQAEQEVARDSSVAAVAGEDGLGD